MQEDQGRSPTSSARASQAKRLHLGQPLQDGVHGAPQRARALAVDDAHLQDPSFPAGLQIVRYQILYLTRGEGVQVELAVYGDLYGLDFIRAVGQFTGCHGQGAASALPHTR